jgi:hypothetical protein
MENPHFSEDLSELSHDFISLNTAKICPSNKPVLDTNRQKKNKTI